MTIDALNATEFNTVCADFYSYLQHQGLLEALEMPLPVHLNAEQLKFLYASSTSLNPREINVSGLDRLLKKILQDAKTEPVPNWWERFIAWLKNVNSERYENEYNWLIKFLETISPSEQTVRIMINGLFVVVVLLASWVSLRELYLAGVFSRKRKRRMKLEPRVYIESMPIHAINSLQAIYRLPPAQQITALLNRMIDILRQRQALPPNPALTNHQLCNVLQQNGHPSEADFTYLVNLAEPALYGNTPPSQQALSSCRRRAEQILAVTKR